MGKSKTYTYDYDDYDKGKNAETMVEDILSDPDFPGLEELVIGCWGCPAQEDCQALLDGFVEHADRFCHITKLFVGDMDFEE